ncbi:hypothetical protein [uncultured Sphingomonas sp.]|uniref:hypothetical protein n=1 Tax=uncultured Sphingomonas sp. TaxID=158754 RepID=UPI0025D0F768|nr:hypothetical protein [uncultured Sphingomonas sp.]
MAEDKTFKLRYVGLRYAGARLPVNVLSDLPAFRDLLVSFAKDEWRARHPDRQRVPKGFDASLTLDLTQIEEGSAQPNLVWSQDVAQQTLPGFEDELAEIVEASYSDIVDLFEGVAAGNDAPDLSPEKLRALDKFGASLRADEQIELTPVAGGNVVFLDVERRKRLITSVRETYNVRLTGVGTLASNSVYGQVIIRTERGDISIPVDPEEIKQNFDGSLDQAVQYDVLVEMDRGEHIRNVLDVFDVAVVDASIEAGMTRSFERLEELGRLKQGWLDGHGAAIDETALRSAHQFITARVVLAGAMRIYPNEGAGVLIELEAGGWDMSLEFAANGSVELYGIEVNGDDEIEPESFADVGEQLLAAFDAKVRH